MKKQKTIWILVCCILAAVLALGVAVYPLVGNYLSGKNKSTVLTEYTEAVEDLEDDSIAGMLAAAQTYNAAISPGLFSDAALQAAAEGYYDLLHVGADGIMGYIEIPKINIYLPIYHGTDSAVLESGVGHLLGSSLPVGGEGTHAVLTGHSGMAREKMFSDLDQLKAGDVFYLHVLNETLAYEVDQIKIVLPDNTEYLGAATGQDYCTLVTCTPFGVNTHRLLVRGHRTAYKESPAEQAAQNAAGTGSTWETEYIKGVLIGCCIALFLLLCGMVSGVFHKRGKHEKR